MDSIIHYTHCQCRRERSVTHDALCVDGHVFVVYQALYCRCSLVNQDFFSAKKWFETREL